MSQTLRSVLARNIRFYRIKLGFSQEALAVKCVMHDNYVSKVELGKVSIGIDNLEKIAKAFKLDPCLLLSKDPPKS